MTKKGKILAALSGGVDSSVAAFLLNRQGFEVVGAFMKNWTDASELKGHCRWYNDRRDALRVAARLGISFVTFDFEEEYRRSVTRYLFKEYAAGRTPNPDVVCNREIKFPLLLKAAAKLGCDYLATGHYARIRPAGVIASGAKRSRRDRHGLRPRDDEYKLLKAKDKNKDQTYFLHQLSGQDLSKIIFPLGQLTKPQVRALAKKHHLPTAEKDESMGICFIGEVPMTDFLMQKIKPRHGKIVDTAGRELGAHQGLAFYTIGQRHALKIPSDEPYYVADKDFKKNILIVAKGAANPALFKKECRLGSVHWISGVPPVLPLKVEVKFRHRHPGAKAVLYSDNRLVFVKPERAVTPGQFAVFYKGEECLGGGEVI